MGPMGVKARSLGARHQQLESSGERQHGDAGLQQCSDATSSVASQQVSAYVRGLLGMPVRHFHVHAKHPMFGTILASASAHAEAPCGVVGGCIYFNTLWMHSYTRQSCITTGQAHHPFPQHLYIMCISIWSAPFCHSRCQLDSLMLTSLCLLLLTLSAIRTPTSCPIHPQAAASGSRPAQMRGGAASATSRANPNQVRPLLGQKRPCNPAQQHPACGSSSWALTT